jgi:integrase
MPGSCVIRYEGVRGVTWRIKFADVDGRQVKETLGREQDGWTEKRAQRELGKRLDLVERAQWRKPQRITFGQFADRFQSEYLPGRNLKRSTIVNYESALRPPTDGRPAGRLLAFFGEHELAKIGPELVDAYVANATRAGLSAKTITNELIELAVMFKVAVRWRLAPSNPVQAVDRPRLEHPEMTVLSEAEVAALLHAYRQLEADADEAERPWWALARRIVAVALGTALRRGELLALRWQDVALLEGRLTVRRAWVRNEMTTPKSRASRRTIDLGPRTVEALQEQWAQSRYQGDEDLVFPHPALGTPLDPGKFTSAYMRPALRRAGIVRPFRPWHDLRHTALTHEAAAGNPQAYVQMKAGHSQGTITERYIHAAQVLFPGAAERGEARIFAVDETQIDYERMMQQ